MIRAIALAGIVALPVIAWGVPVASHDQPCAPRAPVIDALRGQSLAVTWIGNIAGQEIVEL